MVEIFSAQQLADVKAYHWPWYVFSAVDFVVWPIVLALSVAFVARPLFAWSTRVTARWSFRPLNRMWNGTGWAAALLFSLSLFGIFATIYLPTDIYFAFVREHEFGMSRETPFVFAFDHIKQMAVLALSVSMLAFGLYGLARRMKSWWWVMGLVASSVLVVSSVADPYRNRLYFDQTPLPAGVLRDRISALMTKAQIDFRDVVVEKTSEHSVRVQAYFAGQGPTRTIVLNDSLLKDLSEDEVLAVISHEAGHVHESRWLGRLSGALVLFGFLALIEWLFRQSSKRGWLGISERADIRTLPIVLLVFELGIAMAAPVSGALARERESAADRFGLELTQNPDAFRSMFVTAARTNKMDPDPPRWYVWKGLSHPPIAERIASVDAWAASQR